MVGFVVTDRRFLTQQDSHELVLGDFEWLDKHASEVDAIAVGIGIPAARLAIANELAARFKAMQFPPLVHPSVRYERQSFTIDRGAIVCAGVIATVNVKIAEFAVVNLSATIGHEATIGRGSVVNPGVNLSGGVTVGEGVLIGTGAQVLQKLKIGNGATIGAGAVVNRDVEAGATVVGIPAKPIKRDATPALPSSS